MRFARHARIFRGPLDPAPMASVLLLLIIFMLLGSMLYTPGVLVKVGHGQPITVMGNNDIVFDGKTYPSGDLDPLRSYLRAWPGDLSVKVERGADPKIAQEVSNLFEITLPDGKKSLVGTDNATVVVAVNFRGQCFFENRPVQDAELTNELTRRLKIAARNSQKLTLILRMDKAAENQVFTHLCALAGEVGIAEVELAERPAIFDGRPR
jgi:biopolymer transport protein ExbD